MAATHAATPATVQQKDYTALTISHSAPASHQASFERGESVERTRPGQVISGGGNGGGNNSNNNRYADWRQETPSELLQLNYQH